MAGGDQQPAGDDRAVPPRRSPFGGRVVAAVGRSGPLCAGIDPSRELLLHWGLPDDAQGLRRFVRGCLDAFAGVVGIVKPQLAFFERHGAAGLGVFEELIAAAADAGLLVIADAKRGDIGSTMAAYADAWLGEGSPLAADAVTAVPYLGLGALDPVFDTAAAQGRGVLVVVRSSNPEGRPVQRARTDDGRGPSVEDALLAEIAARNGPGGVAGAALGAVVGATLDTSAFPLAEMGGPVLAPGVGAQGATAVDVGRRFGDCPPGSVLPSASRSLLEAGPDTAPLRRAAAQLQEELVAALPMP
ncbi:MAG: orotidine-5'-phosphate decarboxylase [Acidimicrobiales bacterium]|nr:orotidine-5'-phosphate decarboxylase [Acidimicrobiales bacterium]